MMAALQKPRATKPTTASRGRTPAPMTPAPAPAAKSCACGGGCPKCQQKSPVQTKLAISQPGDRFEQEADRVADAVMRMPDSSYSARPGPVEGRSAGSSVQRKITSTATSTATPAAPSGPGINTSFIKGLGSGQTLPRHAREFFEPRFGRDLGDVRIHADTSAGEAARSIDARAFTHGRDVVFGAGEYDPHSTRGRSLIAHELAHVGQQERGANYIQRSLSVSPTKPSDAQDPFSRMGASAFQTMAFSEMGAIINSLCDAFTVDSSGNVVSSPADACSDSGAVAGGAKGVGCCCLCALTAPGSGAWTINVTGFGGPRTEHIIGTPGGEFFLHPRSSTFEFGAWDVTGARAVEDPIVIAGHELCGHGALIERDIHPTEVERVDTDVHNPTVNVENAILAEQGLPNSDRALAAGGHRGESFAHITIRNYAFNGTSIPAAERPKIQLAKDFINANNTWVDILGHSDLVGAPADKLSVSQARADNVRTALTTGTRPVSSSISKTFSNTGAAGTGTATVSGNRFTQVEGRSDFDAIPGAAPADLRRVEIIMPGRPAGANTPNTGTPTAVDPVGPTSMLSFIRRRFFGNACDRLLARTAWF